MTKRTVLARIEGRVQGVFFRTWTQETADDLGLDGWVRNEPDGSVTALISGDAQSVERMAASLRQGPTGARVDKVELEDTSEQAPSGFSVRG